MTTVPGEKHVRDVRSPVTVPPWLLVSGVSSHAVRLYCLYKLGILHPLGAHSVYTRGERVIGVPRSPRECADALRLADVEQYRAVHQELIDVEAVAERREVDDAGRTRHVLLVQEMSPRQRAEDDAHHERFMERLAAERAAANDPDRMPKGVKGFVYVIAQAGSRRVKIGYSTDVARRLKSLQTSNPYPLELCWQVSGDKSLEDALHARFARYRTQGEWFDFGRADPVETVRAAVDEIHVAGVARRTRPDR